MGSYNDYYSSLIKPEFFPPSEIFGIVWGIIYPLIAIAAIYLAYLITVDKVNVKLVSLFVLNMIGNVVYTPVQFELQNLFLASFVIIFVFATISWFEMIAWKYNKILFVLMLPYCVWSAYSTFLQLIITWLNG